MAEKKIITPLQDQEQITSEEVAKTPAVVTQDTAQLSDKSGMNKIARLFVELVLLAGVIFLAIWSFGLQLKNQDLHIKNKHLQTQIDTLNRNPIIAEQRKTNDLIGKVSALIQVPTNEAPQAALVSDADALKKQYPFFTDVQKGDQILFYTKAGKVIVYRPTTDKIVQTGPLNVTKEAQKAE